MAEINNSDLNSMEVFLNQSAKGYHFLFDHKQVAQILKNPTEKMNFFHKNNMPRIQELLTTLLAKKTFQQKQSYLNSLNDQNYEIVVRTYFHILEGAVFASLDRSKTH